MHTSDISRRRRSAHFARRFVLVMASAGFWYLLTGIASAQSPTSRSAPSPAPADNPPAPDADATPTPSPTPEPKKKKEKRGSIIIAPIPVSSPAIGTGLIPIFGYVFKLDKQDEVSPASIVGVAGMRTNNGSRFFGFGGSLYFKEDRFRVLAGAGRFDVNFALFGIGYRAGLRGVSIPFNASGKAMMIQGLTRVHRKGLYLGARFQYRDLRAGLELTKEAPPDILPAVIDDLLRAKTVALGPQVLWDTADSTFYPTTGHKLSLGINFFSQALGSRWNYQTYLAHFDKYIALGKKQVVAYRAMGCSANGRVPVYDLCLYGHNSDLRGYATGQYQGRRMFATQAEYRRLLFSRVGMVAFGGVGGIARRLNEFRFDEFLPAAGVGIRIRLTKAYPINFRADLAQGRSGTTLTISVGEAF